MTTLDIRLPVEEISNILVSDSDEAEYNVTKLSPSKVTGVSYVKLLHGSSWLGCVMPKQDAENLILGLEKAIELGWVK